MSVTQRLEGGAGTKSDARDMVLVRPQQEEDVRFLPYSRGQGVESPSEASFWCQSRSQQRPAGNRRSTCYLGQGRGKWLTVVIATRTVLIRGVPTGTKRLFREEEHTDTHFLNRQWVFLRLRPILKPRYSRRDNNRLQR